MFSANMEQAAQPPNNLCIRWRHGAMGNARRWAVNRVSYNAPNSSAFAFPLDKV